MFIPSIKKNFPMIETFLKKFYKNIFWYFLNKYILNACKIIISYSN
jgi:hypothetical protein